MNVSRLRILFVEDEADIRETLAEILQLHDYDVVPVATAEDGLRELERGQFDLLLTDYNLPGQPGIWLIEEGRKRGLMANTKVLVVTAHTAPRLAADVALMRKPLDIDHFLRRIQELLEPVAAARFQAAGAQVESRPARRSTGLRPMQFTLYVSPDSAASLRALRNMNALLTRYPGLPLELTVCDLSKGSRDQADRDRIAFTPTLVRQSPGPRTWILGTLDDIQPVLDLFEIAGVIPRAVPA